MTDVEKLDAPLTCRAFFIGVARLTQAIESEGLLLRDEIQCDSVSEIVASRESTYRFLCDEFERALRASTSLNDEQDKVLRKFNSCLS